MRPDQCESRGLCRFDATPSGPKGRRIVAMPMCIQLNGFGDCGPAGSRRIRGLGVELKTTWLGSSNGLHIQAGLDDKFSLGQVSSALATVEKRGLGSNRLVELTSSSRESVAGEETRRSVGVWAVFWTR
ncbi:unnamed protein product [Protopolystoma xenopodis]|uniref:Uncharacterized protein n=1 Tax=Protopolystoma xenopodis TaxID=117903 RepID=A0A448XM60_9PLAT|nr:unnamed protein product [Protopolystoma xenopodis]